jgi:hypothetical protein
MVDNGTVLTVPDGGQWDGHYRPDGPLPSRTVDSGTLTGEALQQAPGCQGQDRVGVEARL